jgi:fructose-1,6-bisphosphatase I
LPVRQISQGEKGLEMFEPPDGQKNVVTMERYILREQQFYPEATGVLTNILYDLALAGKYISSQTTRGGLEEILGRAGDVNIQGEDVMKLDDIADRTIYHLNDHTGRLAVMVSEEHEDILPIPDQYPAGKYVLLFDPLDGSSNVDNNVGVGTIFAIFRRKTESGRGTLEDCLQWGRNLIVAGYIFYSVSTMLVYTSGRGVHGFTLDNNVGEFLLTHPNMRFPLRPKYYSANQGNQRYWSAGVQKYTRYLQGLEGDCKPLSARYIGSAVADFHRNLISGGIYYYPADNKDPNKPNGKLRLLYEAAPMAFLAEQAGGYGSDGRNNILDIVPETLHQRTPIFVGNNILVARAEEYILDND